MLELLNFLLRYTDIIIHIIPPLPKCVNVIMSLSIIGLCILSFIYNNMELSNLCIKSIIVLSPPQTYNIKYKFLHISYNIFIKNRLEKD